MRDLVRSETSRTLIRGNCDRDIWNKDGQALRTVEDHQSPGRQGLQRSSVGTARNGSDSRSLSAAVRETHGSQAPVQRTPRSTRFAPHREISICTAAHRTRHQWKVCVRMRGHERVRLTPSTHGGSFRQLDSEPQEVGAFKGGCGSSPRTGA